jgi:hypothetical protein
MLVNFGDHLLEDRRTKADLTGDQPPFLARVPAHTRHILGYAYSELFCLDDQALTMAYLNQTSPLIYPDVRKKNRTLLLYATPELYEIELDKVSSEFAAHNGRALGFI